MWGYITWYRSYTAINLCVCVCACSQNLKLVVKQTGAARSFLPPKLQNLEFHSL